MNKLERPVIFYKLKGIQAKFNICDFLYVDKAPGMVFNQNQWPRVLILLVTLNSTSNHCIVFNLKYKNLVAVEKKIESIIPKFVSLIGYKYHIHFMWHTISWYWFLNFPFPIAAYQLHLPSFLHKYHSMNLLQSSSTVTPWWSLLFPTSYYSTLIIIIFYV